MRNLAVVEQSSVDGCDRDAAQLDAILSNEGPYVVDPNAALTMTGAARDRDIDRPAHPRPQPPQCDRGAVAENRVVAAREYCRHPSAFAGESNVPDGINAAVQPM